MAIITGITKQVKNKDFYNIFIDGDFALGVHGELVLLHGLKEGQRIDQNEIIKIIEEDNKKRAFNHGLYYLSFRKRTQNEVETYLEGKGYKEKAIVEVINKLKDYKMIDDMDYVRSYIMDKLSGNPTGSRRIIYELERKGISQKLLSDISQWYTQDEEDKQAKKVVQKYKKKYEKLPIRERAQKTYMAGQRRGFSWEVLKRALDEDIELEETCSEDVQGIDINQAIYWAEKYKIRYEKKGLEGYVLKQKIGQALANRGYTWEDIQEILVEILKK